MNLTPSFYDFSTSTRSCYVIQSCASFFFGSPAHRHITAYLTAHWYLPASTFRIPTSCNISPSSVAVVSRCTPLWDRTAWAAHHMRVHPPHCLSMGRRWRSNLGVLCPCEEGTCILRRRDRTDYCDLALVYLSNQAICSRLSVFLLCSCLTCASPLLCTGTVDDNASSTKTAAQGMAPPHPYISHHSLGSLHCCGAASYTVQCSPGPTSFLPLWVPPPIESNECHRQHQPASIDLRPQRRLSPCSGWTLEASPSVSLPSLACSHSLLMLLSPATSSPAYQLPMSHLPDCPC